MKKFVMVSLYSYIIPVDDGAAPNPFFGVCTLAICKPKIRKNAKVGDWIIGLGSKNAPSGDLSGKVVYIMEVNEVLTLKEYDEKVPEMWPGKIPDFNHDDYNLRLGDCIYDYHNTQNPKPSQRKGVHYEENIYTDLGGENVLISSNFYYFGNEPIVLPEELKNIIHQGQGHQRPKNAPYIDKFKEWIDELPYESGVLYGKPDYQIDWGKPDPCSVCATTRKKYAFKDRTC